MTLAKINTLDCWMPSSTSCSIFMQKLLVCDCISQLLKNKPHTGNTRNVSRCLIAKSWNFYRKNTFIFYFLCDDYLYVQTVMIFIVANLKRTIQNI